MVNCGVRMVNCRPRVTKHARRKITFFTRPRAPVASLAKESRVKSYIQIISSPLPPQLTCRPCYWRRIYGTCASCTYIVYVCYGIVPSPGWNERLYHRPRRRAHVRSFACRPLSSLFALGRISMPTRDVGVRM